MDQGMILSLLLIFLLRTGETVLCTLTTMFMSQGNKKVAPVIGAIQTIAYITALNIVMSRLNNPINLLMYAFAYGCGIYCGIVLEEKIAYGNVVIQAVIDERDLYIVRELRKNNYLVTVMEGTGLNDHKRFVLFIGVKRKYLPEVRKYLRERKVFMTVSKSDIYRNF